MPAVFEALRRRWDAFFFTGFSGESLGLLRIAFAAGLLPFHVSQFYSLLTIDPFGPGFRYLEPIWYFDLLGIVRDVPWLDAPLFVLLMAATVCMMIGWRTRAAIVVVTVCIFYLKGVRDSYTGDVHHRYLIPFQLLFFLALSRCGEFLSIDARRRAARGEPVPPIEAWEASWPIKAMQLYIASFYLWSVVAKLRVSGWAWFAGDGRVQELLLKRSLMWGVGPDGQAVSNALGFALAQHEGLLALLSLLTFVMELGFPLLLLIRDPWRRLGALLLVSGFHLANFVLLYVGFLFIPFVYFAFFDLVPVWESIRRRWRLRPASGAAGGAGPG